MEEIANQHPISEKKVKPLSEILGEKEFLFPESVANDTDPLTLKKVIRIQVNAKVHTIPINVRTKISYEAFCILKDAKIISPEETYETGKPFDPIRRN